MEIQIRITTAPRQLVAPVVREPKARWDWRPLVVAALVVAVAVMMAAAR